MLTQDREDEFEAILRERRGRLRALVTGAAGARLIEVDAALERIADGTYGWCQGCGRGIPDDRLRARPEARLCAACASS